MADASDPRHPDPSEQHPLSEDCRRCPALVDCRTRISWGVGPLDASLIVVGEAPGVGDPTRERWRGGNHSGMAYTAANSGRKVRSLVPVRVARTGGLADDDERGVEGADSPRDAGPTVDERWTATAVLGEGVLLARVRVSRVRGVGHRPGKFRFPYRTVGSPSTHEYYHP